MLPVKRKNSPPPEPLTLERLFQAGIAIASGEGTTPIIPPDRPDEVVLRYVRELAKRLAREDHEAEFAARQVSQPARSENT
jgi:hypothetical protein